jgi:hypothetical protein
MLIEVTVNNFTCRTKLSRVLPHIYLQLDTEQILETYCIENQRMQFIKMYRVIKKVRLNFVSLLAGPSGREV